MIISHKHKFIFIKTRKTAGTSIEIALSKICGPNDIITPIGGVDGNYRQKKGLRGEQNYHIPLSAYSKKDVLRAIYHRKRLIFKQHNSAADIKEKISSDIWKNYFKFCFERNPFDKAVSWYYYRGRRGSNKYDTIMDFIKSGKIKGASGFELYSINSIPVVDKIYKFEELSESINDINRRLNIGTKEKIELPKFKAKGGIRKDKRHYRDILSDQEAECLSKIFAREIAFFNYKF